MSASMSGAAVRGSGQSLIPATVAALPVRYRGGEAIGTVEKLMIDRRSGSVAYAVLRLAGADGGYATVPWSRLAYNADLEAHEADLSVAELAQAPRRGSIGGEDPSADSEWDAHVHQYFNREAFSDEVVEKASHEAR